jgi:hypothetical protein
VANTGNIFPSVGESVDRAGLTAWTSPTNITSDNATNASCNATGSDYLVARSFDFSSVPTNSTIAGIIVRVEGTESSSGSESILAQLQDETGALTGSSKTQSMTNGPVVLTYSTISDVWSATPTGNKVHDADWGVRVWFATAHNVTIDFVTMQLEYTVPAHGISTETDTCLTLAITKRVAVGISTETDSAEAPDVGIIGPHVSFVDATAVAGSGNPACDAPSGAEDDVMLAFVGAYDSPSLTITPPSGWVAVSSLVVMNEWPSDGVARVYYKIRTGSEPANYTFTSSSGGYQSTLIATYTGVDIAAPVADFDTAQAAGNTGTIPALTVGRDDSMVVVGLLGYESLPQADDIASNTYDLRIANSESALYDEAFDTGGTGGIGVDYAANSNGWIALGVVLQPTGATSIPVDVSTETDTSLTLAKVKIATTGIAGEADTAQTLAAVKRAATGLATETDTALAVGQIKIAATGVSAETDTALACDVEIVSDTQEIQTGLSTETDSALTLSAVRPIATGLVSETDTALTLAATKTVAVGNSTEADVAYARGWFSLRASETDIALTLGALKLTDVELATETDAALGLAASKRSATGRGDETDTALGLAASKHLAIGVAEETDLSLALNMPVFITEATELDAALTLTVVRPISVSVSTETDAAQSLTASKHVATGISEETDLSLALNLPVFVTESTEVDSALALTVAKVIATGVSASTDTALTCAPLKLAATGLATETDGVLAQSVTKLVGLGRSDETDTAFATYTTTFFVDVGRSDTAETVFALSAIRSIATGLATEIDTALTMGRFTRAAPNRRIRASGKVRTATGEAKGRTATTPTKTRSTTS